MAVITGKSRNAAGGPVWRPLSRAVGKLQAAAILGGALFRYAQSRPMGELQGSRYHRHYRAGAISASWGNYGTRCRRVQSTPCAAADGDISGLFVI